MVPVINGRLIKSRPFIGVCWLYSPVSTAFRCTSTVGSFLLWSSSDRRARLPSDWWKIRSTVLRRDGYRCRIGGSGCSGVATEVDHAVRGDDHRLDNLRAVCSSCHRKKTLTEAAAARRRKAAMRFRPTERHPGLR